MKVEENYECKKCKLSEKGYKGLESLINVCVKKIKKLNVDILQKFTGIKIQEKKIGLYVWFRTNQT